MQRQGLRMHWRVDRKECFAVERGCADAKNTTQSLSPSVAGNARVQLQKRKRFFDVRGLPCLRHVLRVVSASELREP